MKKLLIPVVVLVLLVSFLVSGYSRIEVVGLTKDAVQVTVVVTYWSLSEGAKIKQMQAVWLALPEMFVQEIYLDSTRFQEVVIRHSSVLTIVVKTVIPTETIEKLKAASKAA